MSKTLRKHVSDGFRWWGQEIFVLAAFSIVLPFFWLHERWQAWRGSEDDDE